MYMLYTDYFHPPDKTGDKLTLNKHKKQIVWHKIKLNQPEINWIFAIHLMLI